VAKSRSRGWSFWFYRFTAVYFIVSAVTGLLLYFRPLAGERPGWYSERLKEFLIGLHNGELFSWLLTGNRYWSGVVIGAALAFALIRFAVRSLRKPSGR
jgi:hypothetical protein